MRPCTGRKLDLHCGSNSASMKTSRRVRGRGRGSGATVALTAVCCLVGVFAAAQTNGTTTPDAAATTTTTTTNAPPGTNETAKAEETKSSPEFKPVAPGEFNNWLELGGGTSFVSGDKGQFQQRHQVPVGVFGGVGDFHFETPFQKKGLITLDGRGIFDNHDYGITLGLAYP